MPARNRATFRNLKGRLETDEPLAGHTTFGIGGPAQYFLHPKDIPDLSEALREARRRKLPVRIIGAGSNILVADKGVRGVVIKLDAPFFRSIRRTGTRVACGAGVGLSILAASSRRAGLGGIEFLWGIPGTVGGALVMNAGAWGKNISERVEKITVMDYNGTVKEYRRHEVPFGYRTSGLHRFIVLSAVFRLSRRGTDTIGREISAYRRKRLLTQEPGRFNAGCIFKNPPAGSAGYLIEACGFKGRRIAGARVSTRHANFIVNAGQAAGRDVRKLMRLIQQGVRKEFGIILQPEIKVWT